MTLYAKSFAKVNLSLDICCRREDGYHTLRSVMQQISLADELWAQKAENIHIICDDAAVPTDERNIIYKAANAFFAYTGRKGGVRFTLQKNVPSGAGLGGGSSDGATAVKLLDALYDTHLSLRQMEQIVAPIGADVPFFVRGGTQLAEGIGEKLTILPAFTQGAMLLVKPDFPMSTPEIYKALDQLDGYTHPDTDAMIQAVGAGDLQGVADAMGNSMQCVAHERYPQIAVICDRLQQAGALRAIMSGAGSTVFGLFETVQQAEKAASKFDDKTCSVFVVTPICE